MHFYKPHVMDGLCWPAWSMVECKPICEKYKTHMVEGSTEHEKTLLYSVSLADAFVQSNIEIKKMAKRNTGRQDMTEGSTLSLWKMRHTDENSTFSHLKMRDTVEGSTFSQ